MSSIFPLKAGPYSGEFHGTAPPPPALVEELAGIAQWMSGGKRGGHVVMKRELAIGGETRTYAVKSFRRAWWRDAHFARAGSKARHSFAIAMRLVDGGVGTAHPLAWLDRWEGGKLLESYYVCAYEQGLSFKDEVNRLFREDPLARRLLDLLEPVADAVARMHAAGVCHLDLGNQNILVRRTQDDRWDVRFIDLDRARAWDPLTLRQRARDLSRIDLPSAMLRIFQRMYFGHKVPPRDFLRWESHYRKRFALHTASRKYRHPIRTLRSRLGSGNGQVPRKDHWLWDDRSEQAIGTRTKGDRYGVYPVRNAFHVLRGVALALPPVMSRYRELAEQSFKQEVSMAGRIGISAGISEGHIEQERELLDNLGPVPVLIRLYRHETDERNESAVAEATRLKKAGHSIFLALVQDRAGARDAALWREFVRRWLPRFAGIADEVEVGHAVNRVKWGVHHFSEYREMVRAVAEVAQGLGGFRLTGPAAIDFEYHYLAGLLDALPNGSLDAMSHHLYVDRRGAPENRQGRFSSVEKFALARAMAGWSKAVKSDKLIVSEVNWPIAGTGVYSPVAAPYILPGAKGHSSAVDEGTSADFMLRYYALALCSGHVDRVYWWRLVSRGFGLVDDSVEPWRPRAGYTALRQFTNLLGDATFVRRHEAPQGTWALEFRKPDQSRVTMAWTHPAPASFAPSYTAAAVVARDGAVAPVPAQGATLTGSPLYFVESPHEASRVVSVEAAPPEPHRRKAMKSLLIALVTLFGLAELDVAHAQAKEVHVMTSGGFTAAYKALVPEFERASGHKVVSAYGASMGGAPDSIPSRLGRGEPADVVILAAPALEALIKDGKVQAGSRVDLVHSNMGMVVRPGTPKPDISSLEAFRRTLLEAKSIAYSASASGVYLSTELFPKMGVWEQIKDKSKRIESERVAAVVARGDAEIGFQQISELLEVKAADFVGPLPEGAQRTTIFSAGIAANSREPEAAREIIRYFRSPAAAPAIKAAGLDPAP